MDISVNLDTLKTKNTSFKTNIETFKDAIKGIDDTVDEIAGIWSGSDQLVFDDKMKTFIKDLKVVKNSLEDCNNYITTYTEAIEALDSYYADKKIKLQ